MHTIIPDHLSTLFSEALKNLIPDMANPWDHISWNSARYFPRSFSSFLMMSKMVYTTSSFSSKTRRNTQRITPRRSPSLESLPYTMCPSQMMKSHRYEKGSRSSTRLASEILLCMKTWNAKRENLSSVLSKTRWSKNSIWKRLNKP